MNDYKTFKQSNATIPKVIHYCWFGEKPLPRTAVKCINSWNKFFPGFEIKEWNESNYNVKKVPYIAEAYEEKKFAFVSDYARFDILFQYGGVYFDTDVEVIKPFNDILEHGSFMGCEIDGGEKEIQVAPGLGIAATPGLDIFKEILYFYSTQHFLNDDGSINTETVVKKTTKVLREHGLKDCKGIQSIAGITIYPREYFNPLQDSTGVLTVTENTRSIHWYTKTWIDSKSKIKSKLTRPFHRLFGDNCFTWLKKQ